MNKLQQTRKKGVNTLIAISIIGVAVYLGFDPLFDRIGGGVAGAVVGASFGAIFVIVLTMYLLNKQTEIEQESKKSERIFEEKVKLYYAIYDDIESMLENSSISKEDELKKLPFIMARLITIGSDEVINSFGEIYKAINKIYENKPDDDNVVIDSDQEKGLIIYLTNFAKTCRLDLGVSDKEVSTEIMKSSLESIKKSTAITTGRNVEVDESKDPMSTEPVFAELFEGKYEIRRYKSGKIRIYKDGEHQPKDVKKNLKLIDQELGLDIPEKRWSQTQNAGYAVIKELNKRKNNRNSNNN